MKHYVKQLQLNRISQIVIRIRIDTVQEQSEEFLIEFHTLWVRTVFRHT